MVSKNAMLKGGDSVKVRVEAEFEMSHDEFQETCWPDVVDAVKKAIIGQVDSKMKNLRARVWKAE